MTDAVMEFQGRSYLNVSEAAEYTKLSKDQLFVELGNQALVYYRGWARFIDATESDEPKKVDGLFWIADDAFVEVGFLWGNQPDIDHLNICQLCPHYMMYANRLWAGSYRNNPAFTDIYPCIDGFEAGELVLTAEDSLFFWKNTLDDWLDDYQQEMQVDPSTRPIDVLFPISQQQTTVSDVVPVTPVTEQPLVRSPYAEQVIIRELPATGFVSVIELISIPAPKAPDSNDQGKRRSTKVAPAQIGILRISRAQLYKMIKMGKFPEPQKHGTRSLWPVEEVRQWIDQQKLKPASKDQEQ